MPKGRYQISVSKYLRELNKSRENHSPLIAFQRLCNAFENSGLSPVAPYIPVTGSRFGLKLLVCPSRLKRQGSIRVGFAL